MPTYRSLIDRFFVGLRERDAEAIAACYARDAEYSSHLLGRVVGARVPAYWRMICARANMHELRIEAVDADPRGGVARWTARYACGRQQVRHVVESTFRFDGGRISRQHDRLDACPGGRTVGSHQLFQDESSPLLTCLRARGLVALDAFVLRAPVQAEPISDRRGHRLHSPPPRLALSLDMTLSLNLERTRS
jgi:limonene-1,2-epoxide hydrolase